MKFSLEESRNAPPEELLSEGKYNAQIVYAEDMVSKNGNEMIKLKLRINHNNIFYHIYDYLVATFPGKIENFCNATNQHDKFSSQELVADDCQGRLINVYINTQQDKDGKYPPKNVVKEYIVNPVVTEHLEFDDSIPF